MWLHVCDEYLLNEFSDLDLSDVVGVQVEAYLTAWTEHHELMNWLELKWPHVTFEELRSLDGL